MVLVQLPIRKVRDITQDGITFGNKYSFNTKVSMYISRLKLLNFKRFPQADIDLSRDITVLLGPNSSGKSSIIKALLALKQTASPTNENETFATQGEYVDLGIYKDYVYEHKVENKIEISPTFCDFPANPFFEKSFEPTFSITFGHDHVTEQARLLEIAIKSKEDQTWIQIAKKKTRDSFLLRMFDIEQGRRYGPQFDDRENDRLRRSWERGISIQVEDRYMFSSINKEKKDYFEAAHFPVWIANHHLDAMLRSLETEFFYLGPLRRSPVRSYSRTAHLLSVGPAGEHTPSVLANLKARAAKERSARRSNRERLQQLNNWVELLFPSKMVDTKTIDELVKLVIGRTSTQVDAISDVGFGMSQVLPILVQIAVMPDKSTLLIEQPELHLHPHVQTKFAEVIALAAKSGRRFVIETHSEHFVRGLQVAVSNSRAKARTRVKLDRENLSFIYIPTAPEVPFLMELNEWGEFTREWPKGFFDESYRLTMLLLQNKMKTLSAEQRTSGG